MLTILKEGRIENELQELPGTLARTPTLPAHPAARDARVRVPAAAVKPGDDPKDNDNSKLKARALTCFPFAQVSPRDLELGSLHARRSPAPRVRRRWSRPSPSCGSPRSLTCRTWRTSSSAATTTPTAFATHGRSSTTSSGRTLLSAPPPTPTRPPSHHRRRPSLVACARGSLGMMRCSGRPSSTASVTSGMSRRFLSDGRCR